MKNESVSLITAVADSHQRKRGDRQMSTGIEYIDLGAANPRVIGMKVTGRLTAEGMAEFISRLEEVTAEGGKARVFVDMAGYDGFEPGVAKEKLSHMGTLWNGIERVAYIVDEGWLSGWIGLVDAVTPMHLRALIHLQPFSPELETFNLK